MTWLLKLLEGMSPTIVAALKEGLAKLLKEVYKKALETDNKLDDRAIEIIAQVVGISLEE